MTAPPHSPTRRPSGLFRSIAAKAILLVIVFLLVPLIVYSQFREADQEKRRLILESLATQGELIAASLFPDFQSFDDQSVARAQAAMTRMALEGLKIRLLFRPREQSRTDSFFYIASAPQVDPNLLQQERSELIATGVFERLTDSCEGNRPLGIHYRSPEREEEVLTSIIPSLALPGCWVVITSSRGESWIKASLQTPYWQSPEVLVAAVVYGAAGLIILSLFLGTRADLKRFTKLARAIRGGQSRRLSFADLNKVPELSGIAREFDGLVATLRDSAETIRATSEENAHAFKTPIGVIIQSLEPLKQSRSLDRESARALELIERAVDRLGGLVTSARRTEEVTAQTMEPADERIPLSALLRNILDDYADSIAARGLLLEAEITEGIEVLGSEEMIETVIENLLGNALDFSPRGLPVKVTLEYEGGNRVRLKVADQGPGVGPERHQEIFNRYVSDRRSTPAVEGPEHFGLGLWLVRRNIEAMGGRVWAEANKPNGLVLTVSLPALG